MNCYRRFNPTNSLSEDQHTSVGILQPTTEVRGERVEIPTSDSPVSPANAVDTADGGTQLTGGHLSGCAEPGKPEGIVRVEEKAGVSVVVLEGDILYEQADVLNEILDSLVHQEGRNVLLDLRDSRYVSARALGSLISKTLKARRKHGDVKLLFQSLETDRSQQASSPNSELHYGRPACHVYRLLEITGVATVFDIFDSEPAALASFKKPISGPEKRLLWEPV